MPTQKPRIMLTVPNEINDLLERLSDLSGTPKTKLIIEMLEQYAPVLDQVVTTMQKIQDDKDNGKEIAKKFAQDMLFQAHEFMGLVAKEAKEL